MSNKVEYGQFEGTLTVHALGTGGSNEFTLCGVAFDAGDSGDLDGGLEDLEGGGSWIPCKGPVTCPLCIDTVRHCRRVRVQNRTLSRVENIRAIQARTRYAGA